MENIRSRADIKLKSQWDGRQGARMLIARPNFKRYAIFDENLVAIELNKTHILMNKPIAIGLAVLDISKVVMYDFHYNFMKPKYGENISLNYTDTDSFIYHVKTECFYSDMKQDIEKYDTSDYASDNVYNLPRVNKKVPGLFKDELNGAIVTDFVGLRSKMYCVRTGKIDKMKKAKGVKKYVLKKEISFENYLECLMHNTSITKKQNTFRTKLHNMYTVTQEKVALSPFDDKRYVLSNNIDTLAWGHYNAPKEMEWPKMLKRKFIHENENENNGKKQKTLNILNRYIL